MKTIILSMAACVTLLTGATNVNAKTGFDPIKFEKTAGASIVGKWKAVDMKIDGMDDAAKQKQITESIVGEQMTWEFKTDGTVVSTSKSQPEETDKYTVKGNKLETTEKDGKKETMEIVKSTDTQLIVRMETEKMNLIFEKM